MSTEPETVLPPYAPVAIYFPEGDCVEYVREDAFVVYERVDSRLTLIHNFSGDLVGFKIKGFHVALDRLRTALELSDGQYLTLVRAIEEIYTEIGETVTADPRVRDAYRAAFKLAANYNVKLELVEAVALAA